MSRAVPVPDSRGLYGVMAEYETPEALLDAVRATRAAGYARLEAYTPQPVEHLAEALGFHGTRLPVVVAAGGVAGGLTGYFLQLGLSAVWYPMNVGGRPLNSWPAFVPVTFELTILGASVAAVLGMLALNGLPMPYHPVFNAPRFELASRSRFFLCVEAADPRFDRAATARFLESTGAARVFDVER